MRLELVIIPIPGPKHLVRPLVYNYGPMAGVVNGKWRYLDVIRIFAHFRDNK